MKAFLLTRQWRDTPRGVELVFWASSERGAIRLVIPEQKAICFILNQNQLKLPATVQRKPLKLRDFKHRPVDGLYFSQQRELNRLREHLAFDKEQLYESEIKPADRYLMERFITAPLEINDDITQKNGYLEVINPRIKPIDYTPELHWASIDIETEDLRGKLYSIAVTTSTQEQVFMVQNGAHLPETDLALMWCKNEREALQQFFAWIRKTDPDVIIGWNVVAFDLDFLQWKCKQLGVPFAMGRGDNHEAARCAILKPQLSGQMHIARIPGRAVLDGIASLRAAFWSFESFALGHVAKQLLGRDKLISEKGESGLSKLEEIRRQYREDPLQLAEYNLEDCRLVAEIFARSDLINFSIARARMTGLAIDRNGGSAAAFDYLYLPRLHRHGFVAPDVGSHPNKQHSPGGFVMESQPGLYDNVLVLDFKSLYPSIIRTFKIDPLGLIVKNDAEAGIPGFLGAEFSRNTHILPGIVSQLWKERDAAKRANNQPLSHAIKIIMNSFYGVLGSFGCRFFNPQLASSITKRGHQIIQKSKEIIEQQGHTVIYGDTDSVFVLLGEGKSASACQQIGVQLQTLLNDWWRQHLAEQFQLESHLEIEFETHYLRFLMPTLRGTEKGSKKRYAGMINKNGEHKIIYKGLESVRSDWTLLAREFQQELYQRIFHKEPFEDYIKQIHNDLLQGKLNDKLTYTKRLRRPLESYTSTQPPQVKATRKMKNPGRKIRYIITLNGPEPTEKITSIPDYQHYVDKQLAPVADSILHFLGTSFEKITARQMDVFG